MQSPIDTVVFPSNFRWKRISQLAMFDAQLRGSRRHDLQCRPRRTVSGAKPKCRSKKQLPANPDGCLHRDRGPDLQHTAGDGWWSRKFSKKLEVPAIYKAYFLGLCKRISPQFIWPYMVQYLHFRILKFPLNLPSFTAFLREYVRYIASGVNCRDV